MAENGAQLTPQQNRAIALLIASKNTRAAAKAASIKERTLYTWLADPAFVAALRAAESALIDVATRRLLNMQDAALNTLEKLLAGELVDNGVKLRAALGILSTAIKLRELRDVESRLAALEAANANAQK